MKNRLTDRIMRLTYSHRALFIPIVIHAAIWAVIWSPMLFGFEPICVISSESEDYIPGTFTYCRYEEQAVREGDLVVLYSREDGAEIACIKTLNAKESIFETVSGTVLRVEYIAGTPSAFYVEYFGTVFNILFPPAAILITGLPAAVVAAVRISAKSSADGKHFVKNEEMEPAQEDKVPEELVPAEDKEAEVEPVSVPEPEIAALAGMDPDADETLDRKLARYTEIVRVQSQTNMKVIEILLEAERKIGALLEDDEL